VRVDICPMVFLARTSRFRNFRFSEDLQVGEHEQFFYANAYLGMQVAVCMDSSFPHFRIDTMTAAYVKRRERMPQLMQAAFRNLGFERAMFLFRKYSHGSAADYDELLDKAVPPWHISDDTCGQRPSPPVPFAQVFVIVLTTGDTAGMRYRHVLRGYGVEGVVKDTSSVWLQRLAGLGPGALRWLFAVIAREEELATQGSLLLEKDQHQDMIFISHGNRPSAAIHEPSSEQLLQLFGLIRDFQFRWLIIAKQDVFVQPDRLLAALQQHEPPTGKVLGAWRPAEAHSARMATASSQGLGPVVAEGSGGTTWQLDVSLFALARDVFALLSAPEVLSRLASMGSDVTLGSLADLVGGLSIWLRALAVKRVSLPSVFLRDADHRDGVVNCPSGTLALHPVTAEELQAWSQLPAGAFPC